MRNVLFIISFMLLTYSCGTMMGAESSPEQRSFQKIMELPNQNKDQLYVKANSWFVETFNSAESVIEYQDKEAGKIMGKYTFNYAEGVYTYDVKQTVDISIKDKKVRIKIDNPLYRATSGMGETYHNTSFNALKSQKGIDRAQQEWNMLAASLENYLKQDDAW